jgi:hypothetical protein
MKSLHSFALVVLAVTALAACGGDTSTQPTVDPATTVATTSANAPRTTLAVGNTLQLAADASNAIGTILVGKPINWASSRPNVATITSQGLVKGLVVGTTLITATSEGHAGSVTLSVQAPNQILLTSDPGDYIGAGAAYSYTNANASILITASATTIQLSIAGQQEWSATFRAPSGVQLAQGSYTNATRSPFQGSGAGMNWTGEGRQCNSLTGFFTIDSLSWSSGIGTSLAGLDLRFEQRCEGGAAALRGTIHWRLDDPTVWPGPVTPIPSNLWQPPASVIAVSGNAVYLQSQQGDYIGKGATNLYQTNVTVSGNWSYITISAGGYSGNFQGLNSMAHLKVGYYGDLQRYPFNSPVQGGLDWSGNGRGCNTLTGWFAVDRVTYTNGVLAGIELRFEQHCEGQSAALYGFVRWGQLS